jgi:GNAT superfamily N-acetyltransferase
VISSDPVPTSAGILVRASERPGLRLAAVWLRPLSSGETDIIERVFTAMSAESRRLRFLAPVPRLTTRALHRLADVDHNMHGCWVAFVHGAPAGLGRYARLPQDPAAADLALEVVDHMQGKGLGKLLLATVLAAGGDAGVRSLIWLADAANAPVRHLGLQHGARFATEYGLINGRASITPGYDPYTAEVAQLARTARLAATKPSPEAA